MHWKLQKAEDLVTFTEEILNGKLLFLCLCLIEKEALLRVNAGLPQKNLAENPGLSSTIFLIFQGISFTNSSTFPGLFKKLVLNSRNLQDYSKEYLIMAHAQ